MKQFIAWLRTQAGAALLGSVSLPVLTIIAERILTGDITGLRPLVAAAIGAVCGLLVGYGMRKKSEPPQPPENVGDRIFSPRSPSELAALTEGKTEIAARAATKPHIGTWLQFQGRVVDVVATSIDVIDTGVVDGNLTVVDLEGSRHEPMIEAHFRGSWWKSIQILAVGDQITVRGEIDDISPDNITLTECELV